VLGLAENLKFGHWHMPRQATRASRPWRQAKSDHAPAGTCHPFGIPRQRQGFVVPRMGIHAEPIHRMKPIDPSRCGLYCAPAIEWLIATEKQVLQQVTLFLHDMASDRFTVAGPPTITEIMRLRRDKSAKIQLPIVTLSMRMITHHLSGNPMISVTCSDDDLAAIDSWRIIALFKSNSLRPEEIQQPRGIN
jgi:hypothetical protein